MRGFPKPIRKKRSRREAAIDEGMALYELDRAMKEVLASAGKMAVAYERVLEIRRELGRRAHRRLEGRS